MFMLVQYSQCPQNTSNKMSQKFSQNFDFAQRLQNKREEVDFVRSKSAPATNSGRLPLPTP